METDKRYDSRVNHAFRAVPPNRSAFFLLRNARPEPLTLTQALARKSRAAGAHQGVAVGTHVAIEVAMIDEAQLRASQ